MRFAVGRAGFEFNPDQARDDHGRWAGDGAGPGVTRSDEPQKDYSDVIGAAVPAEVEQAENAYNEKGSEGAEGAGPWGEKDEQELTRLQGELQQSYDDNNVPDPDRMSGFEREGFGGGYGTDSNGTRVAYGGIYRDENAAEGEWVQVLKGPDAEGFYWTTELRGGEGRAVYGGSLTRSAPGFGPGDTAMLPAEHQPQDTHPVEAPSPQGDSDHSALRASGGLRFRQSGLGRRLDLPPPALVAAAPVADVAEIARVAEDHAPEGGYGETAWNPDDRVVFWTPADWSTDEEVEAALADFLAIEGVEGAEAEREAALPVDNGWEVVWTPPLAEESSPTETAAERWDKLAREAEEAEREGKLEIETVFAQGSTRAPGSLGTLAMLRFAADEVDAARSRELEALTLHRATEQAVVRDTLRTMRTLAEKPAGDTHVHVPTEIHPHVTIHEPDVVVEAAPAPDVSVVVEPPSVTVEPPQVTVEAAPAPSVTVDVAPPDVSVEPPQVSVTVEVPAPEPRPRAVRATKNEADGSMTFEAVDEDE